MLTQEIQQIYLGIWYNYNIMFWTFTGNEKIIEFEKFVLLTLVNDLCKTNIKVHIIQASFYGQIPSAIRPDICSPQNHIKCGLLKLIKHYIK